jgi:hypothetical protein
MVSHIRSCGYSWACPQSWTVCQVSARFQAIGGQVGVVTLPGLAALPESEFFFSREKVVRKVSVRQSLLSKPHVPLGDSPTGVEKIFSARPQFETSSSGLQAKACIQNSGNS